MSKETLGHIDCPCCNEKMRITHDKNGDPFGYCEDGCLAQLRVGGRPGRVRSFIKKHPWAAGKADTDNRTVADLANDIRKAGMTTASAVHEDKPTPAPAKPAAPAKAKSANPFDFLLNQGAKA